MPAWSDSPARRRVGDSTPAADQAGRATLGLTDGRVMLGHFPPALPLLVLAGCALAFGSAAKRFFRWE